MSITNPCVLLSRLLQEQGESTWLEFKTNNANPEAIGEYISALANGAMLADRDRAYLIYGVENKTKNRIGTEVAFAGKKNGGEDFENWINRLVEPKILIEFLDFECEGVKFAMVVIEPTYDRPVKFQGTEYIRIGENKKRLIEYPEHERALWLATGRRKFENAIALSNKTQAEVLEVLDMDVHYNLTSEPKPKKNSEIVRRMVSAGFIIDNMDGRFDITNLGAILLAKDIRVFPSIAAKSIRVVKYKVKEKAKSEFEQEGQFGYAHGFVGLMRFIIKNIPSQEIYVDGVRRQAPVYPEIAVREVLANALIHQDFTISGAGPLVEIYSNRIEIINPGNSLIETDRMLDERRSRNEKLAATMRSFGLCEERGGGLDKTMIAIEETHLPAPDFISSQNSMRVVLFGPKKFSEMTKQEKQRACFFHCIIRWIKHDYMGNASLRERFLVADDDYQAVSAVITEAVRAKRIIPLDPNQGKRNARYVPYWVG